MSVIREVTFPIRGLGKGKKEGEMAFGCLVSFQLAAFMTLVQSCFVASWSGGRGGWLVAWLKGFEEIDLFFCLSGVYFDQKRTHTPG